MKEAWIILVISPSQGGACITGSTYIGTYDEALAEGRRDARASGGDERSVQVVPITRQFIEKAARALGIAK